MFNFDTESHNLRFLGPEKEMIKGLSHVKSLLEGEQVEIERLKDVHEKGQTIFQFRILSEGKILSLPELQKRTEDKILYLRKQSHLNKNDTYIQKALKNAIESRKFYKNLSEESQLTAWKSSRENAKSFYVDQTGWNSTQMDDLQKVFPDQEIDITRTPDIKDIRRVYKIDLKRAGKELSFEDLVILTAKKVDTLRQWIVEAKNTKTKVPELEKQLSEAIRLKDSLEYMSDHVVGLKKDVQYNLFIEGSDWKPIKEALQAGLEGIEFKREKKGSITFIEIKKEGVPLELSQLKALISKTDQQLDAKTQMVSQNELLVAIQKQRTALTQLLHQLESVKESPPSTLYKVSNFFKKYATTSLRFIFKSEIGIKLDACTNIFTSFDALIKDTYADEAEILVNSSGYTQTIQVKGYKLTKNELLQKTAKKIEQLQIAFYTINDTGKKQKLHGRITAANQLMKQLKNSTDQRSLKQYGWLALTLPISLIFSALVLGIVYGVKGAKKLHDYTVMKFDEHSDPIHSGMVRQAYDLKHLLESNNPLSFKVAYNRIKKEVQSNNEDESIQKQKLEVLDRTLRNMGSALLKSALEKGNLADVNFLIKAKLMNHVSKSVLIKFSTLPYISKQEQEELITNLFLNFEDSKSMERVIEYLQATGEHRFAETLLLMVFTRKSPLIIPNATRLLAAKIGSKKILEAAFNIEDIDTISDIDLMAKVTPYLYIANRKGKTLLHYACEGSNAKFVTAVDKAIRQDLIHHQDVSQNTQLFLQFLDEKPTRAQIVSKIEEFNLKESIPRLAELEKTLLTGRSWSKPSSWFIQSKLKKMLEKEVINRLYLSPFHAKDKDGNRPISFMSMSLAHDLDLYNQTPKCFTNAVQYYLTVNSLRMRWIKGVEYSGELSNSAGVAILTNYAHTTNFLQKNLILQSGLAILGFLGWLSKESNLGKIVTKHWMGFSRNLTEYETKNRIDDRRIKPSPSSSRIKQGLLAIKHAFLSVGGGEKHQQILTAMENQNADDALNRIKDSLQSLGAKTRIKGHHADEILTAYKDLIVYSNETREKLLEQLFISFSYSEHIVKALKIQIEQGETGKKCVKDLVEKQLAEWKNEGDFTLEQYKASLMTSVMLGEEDLYDRILAFKPGKIAFDLADGWHATGGKDTSLLHLTAISTHGKSNEDFANIGYKVIKEMTASNRFMIQADPFEEGEKRDLNPTSLYRGDKRVGEVMTKERANRFDDRVGFMQNESGFSKVVQMREHNPWEYIDKIAQIEPFMLFVNLSIATFNLKIVTISAALGMAVAGPALSYTAAVASCFTLSSLVYACSFVDHLTVGKGIKSAMENAGIKARGYDNRVGEYGETQESVEEAVNREDQVRLRKFAATFVINEIKTQVEKIKENNGTYGDPLLNADLDELIASLAQIGKEPLHEGTFKKIAEAIWQADLPPYDFDQLQTNLLQRLQSKDFYDEMNKGLNEFMRKESL